MNSPFTGVKRFFYTYLLKKRMRALEANRETVNLSKASKIGVLYRAGDELSEQAVEKYVKDLRAAGKEVQVLGYLRKQKKKMPAPVLPFFSGKEVNWLHIPSAEAPKKFAEERFDILLNLYHGESLPLEYISTLSAARYRVGAFAENKTHCYDLMIRLGEQQGTEQLIEQIDHYIKLLNKDATV